MKKSFILVAALALAGLVSTPVMAKKSKAKAAPQATATLAPTAGNAVKGSAKFVQQADGKVKVTANISGLTPGAHGFHVHEKGDCSAPDGTSAGGHFNPLGKQHGKSGSDEHHVGDLPSLEANDKGDAKVDVVLESVTLEGDNTIVGRALIVHAAPDDFTTQPTGNAGARVACAVIEEGKGKSKK